MSFNKQISELIRNVIKYHGIPKGQLIRQAFVRGLYDALYKIAPDSPFLDDVRAVQEQYNVFK